MNLIEKDKKYIWHPYTYLRDYETLSPILITKAKGIKLYDFEGNTYFDTISSWWCNLHGHSHPKIVKAINSQIQDFQHVMFAGLTHQNAIILAEKLIKLTPKKLTKVFYSDNGTTAVEVALKLSILYWKYKGKKRKNKFISLENAYHGDTVFAMSLSENYREEFKNIIPQQYKIPSPNCYMCTIKKKEKKCNIECLHPLEELLKYKHEEICGIIIEPLLQGAGGMIMYPTEYLVKLEFLVKKYNIHLIVDEVATGFGRTGKMFAINWTNVEPDFMCLSKGVTNGVLPLGVTLVSEEIYTIFYKAERIFLHGHTFTGNAIATRVGVTSLEIFEEEEVLKRVNEKLIPTLEKEKERFKSIDIIGDVRQIGVVVAFELVEDKEKKQHFNKKKRIGWKIYLKGLKEGLILRPINEVIYLFLPLATTEEEAKEIMDRTYFVFTHFSP
jgi:adenosylmethionine-8-amino-7-oxononanoate aminotransferase